MVHEVDELQADQPSDDADPLVGDLLARAPQRGLVHFDCGRSRPRRRAAVPELSAPEGVKLLRPSVLRRRRELISQAGAL